MTRILHWFGNWKWTGPAELVLESVAALRDESALWIGACPFPDLEQPIVQRAESHGLAHRVLGQLRKHHNPLRLPAAVREVVAALSSARAPEILHVHFDSDHAVAQRARARLRPRPALVRSVHERPPHSLRRRALLQKSSDLVLAPTAGLARELELSLRWKPGSVGVLAPGVDLDRFHPRDESWRVRGRARLAIPESAFVVGLVARVQSHRRFDLLIDTWSRLHELENPPHLVVFGRGTAIDSLLRNPARKRGLQDLVHSPGYLEGDEYLEGLSACDAGLYLVPGTDVTCRAVREWMAMGRGVLATRRPPLPELIRDGIDGALFEETAASLGHLLMDANRTAIWRQRGVSAAERALREFHRGRVRDQLRCYYDQADLARAGRAQSWSRAARACAIVRPGHVSCALKWAADRGVEAAELVVMDPDRSRDIGINCLSLLGRSGATKVLIEPHREWDRAVIDELRSVRKLETTLLVSTPQSDEVEAAEAQPRSTQEWSWILAVVPDHWPTTTP